MSSTMYRLWTRDEIVLEIRSLEEQLNANVISVSHSGAGGSVTHGTPENARKTLRQLYARLDEIDGVKRVQSVGMRFTQLLSDR